MMNSWQVEIGDVVEVNDNFLYLWIAPGYRALQGEKLIYGGVELGEHIFYTVDGTMLRGRHWALRYITKL